jgi:hypothetical protein
VVKAMSSKLGQVPFREKWMDWGCFDLFWCSADCSSHIGNDGITGNDGDLVISAYKEVLTKGVPSLALKVIT